MLAIQAEGFGVPLGLNSVVPYVQCTSWIFLEFPHLVVHIFWEPIWPQTLILRPKIKLVQPQIIDPANHSSENPIVTTHSSQSQLRKFNYNYALQPIKSLVYLYTRGGREC